MGSAPESIQINSSDARQGEGILFTDACSKQKIWGSAEQFMKHTPIAFERDE
jgi:hypothetical protein